MGFFGCGWGLLHSSSRTGTLILAHSLSDPRRFIRGSPLTKTDRLPLGEVALTECAIIMCQAHCGEKLRAKSGSSYPSKKLLACPWSSEWELLRSGTCPEERRAKQARVGWSPQRGAGKVDGPCAGCRDGASIARSTPPALDTRTVSAIQNQNTGRGTGKAGGYCGSEPPNKIDGPFTGCPDSSSDSEPKHELWNLDETGSFCWRVLEPQLSLQPTVPFQPGLPLQRPPSQSLRFPWGRHLTGCDSSLGHPFRPMQRGTSARPQHFGPGTSSSDPTMSLAAKPWGSRCSGTCAMLRSPTSGSTTWTRAREVSSRRTTTLPMCRKLGCRLWVGGGQCRCCGSFLDPKLEHAETCSTAEATRGHYACVHAVLCGMKLADPGITTEHRGLTASQSRPVDILTNIAVPWTYAWPLPSQRQPAEMLHRRHSIVN